ncbi:MAG: TspO/MBR family protein [Steroidobacteraceae bacterium]
MKQPLVRLAGWMALSLVVATLGGLASLDAGTFYAQLRLPAWAPPGWVFGPVWTLLYALMAVAAWMVGGTEPSPRRRLALALYVAQLLPNVAWSWLFFHWRLGGFALADIAVLWLLVSATRQVFHRQRALAAMLLLPYLVWISFAMALNYVVWRLNPGLLG